MPDELIIILIVIAPWILILFLVIADGFRVRHIYHRVCLYPSEDESSVIVLNRARLFKKWKRSGDTSFDRYEHYYWVYLDNSGKYYLEYTRRFVFIEERWVKRYDTWEEIAEEYIERKQVEPDTYFCDRKNELLEG